jgi:hypothetical protein
VFDQEKLLMRRLKVLEQTPYMFRDDNRTRYLSSLRTKASSGVLSEPERIAQAQARMEEIRDEVREQIAAGHHETPHPARGSLHTLLLAHGEQEDLARRARVEVRAWRAQAAAREARRAAHAADARTRTGSAIGAHERGLESIARTNGQ